MDLPADAFPIISDFPVSHKNISRLQNTLHRDALTGFITESYLTPSSKINPMGTHSEAMQNRKNRELKGEYARRKCVVKGGEFAKSPVRDEQRDSRTHSDFPGKLLVSRPRKTYNEAHEGACIGTHGIPVVLALGRTPGGYFQKN